MRLKTILSAAALAAASTSCATDTGLALRDALLERGARAGDEAVKNAEIALCRALPVGAVVRNYGQSAERWDAWRVLCRYADRVELDRPAPAPSE